MFGGHRVKRIDIWDSGVLVGHILGTFDLIVFNAIFRIMWCTCPKMAYNSKIAGRCAKWIEIWDSGGGGGSY